MTRGCQTGGTIPNLNNCDGGLGTGGDLMDYVVIEGTLRNSNTDPNGLGVPGGAAGVLYRVGANGSGNGVRCANTTNPQPIGFLAAEGFNGLAGDGDDAVAGGGAGADGDARHCRRHPCGAHQLRHAGRRSGRRVPAPGGHDEGARLQRALRRAVGSRQRSADRQRERRRRAGLADDGPPERLERVVQPLAPVRHRLRGSSDDRTSSLRR